MRRSDDMAELGAIIDRRNLATSEQVTKVNTRVSNLEGETSDVKEIAESSLKVAVIEYAVGTSYDTPPNDGWSSSTPKWTKGKFIWQRTTVTDGKGQTTTTTACIQGAKGDDAVLLSIESVNGTQFKNTGVNTTMTVTIRIGDTTITDSNGLAAFYGDDASLAWSEKKVGETDFTPLSSDDSRIGDKGFYITLGTDDVDGQSVFECELNIGD